MSIKSLLQGTRLGNRVTTDLNALSFTRECPVSLAELLGDTLGHEVADLVRIVRIQGAELLQLEEGLFLVSVVEYAT